MSRLIDADALMTELSTMYKEPTSTEDFMTIGYDKAIADVVVTAHRQPTVDAVEVVRCRDCIWWDIQHPYGTLVPNVYYCERNRRFYSANHFCGYGGRKE